MLALLVRLDTRCGQMKLSDRLAGGASLAARRCALREYCKIMASLDSSLSRRSIPVALLCACPKVEDARLYKKARMPRNTCGIDATYYFRGISQFVAVNGDNQSKVWTSAGGLPRNKKECDLGGGCKALSTGTGLCGTYVWWGVSKVQKGGNDTGEAFEMEFIFKENIGPD